MGLSTSPVALVAGGGVAEGLRGGALIAALLIGAVLLSTLAATQGVLGQRTGLPLAALTARALGTLGSRWIGSTIMLAMMLGWFGVNVGLAGVAVARLAGLPTAVGICLFAAAMLATAMRGLGVLSWLALVAGMASVLLAAHGLGLALEGRQVELGGGLAGSEPMSIAAGITLMVGYGSAFCLRTPDFTHELPGPRSVLLCAAFGLCIPLIVMAGAGAVLYSATGEWDLAEALHRLGSSQLAYLFIAVGFTGSVLTNVWSGGLALADVAPRLGVRTAQVLVTALGAAAAMAGLADRALDWLTLMAYSAPGLVVLCVVAPREGRGSPTRTWSPHALSAWFVGIFAAIALHVTGVPLALLAAAAVPLGVYGLLECCGRTRTCTTRPHNGGPDEHQ